MRLVFIVLLSVVFLPFFPGAADLGAADLGTTGWTPVGTGATVAASDGVLTFHYEAGLAQRSAAVLPAQGIPFTEMKGLRFDVRTDGPFAVGFVLGEMKPGGANFSAAIWSAGEDWQQVVLKPEDFSSDKGGRLALTQIQDVALTDLSQLAGTPQNDRVYFEPHSGPHTIWVRNFELLRDAAPAVEPQSPWFGLGGSSFEEKDGATIIRYRGRGDRWIAFTRLLPPGDRGGATHLALEIQSERDAQLVISLREGQTRHNIDFFVPAGKALDHREVLLSAFSNGAVDAAAARSVTILDVGDEELPNSITIRDLRFVTQ